MKKLEQWQTNLYILWVIQIFSMVGFGLGLPFIPYYFQEMGVTDRVELNFIVSISATLPALSMAFMAPIWGKLSDIYGRKMMQIRAMIAGGCVLAAYGFANTVIVFLILRLMHGLFTGTISAALTFVSANTPTDKQSYAIGIMTSSNFLGSAIGPTIGGFLAEIVGYENCFFIGSAVMFLGSLLAAVFLKEDPSTYGREFLETSDSGRNKKGGSHSDSPAHHEKIFTKLVVSILVIVFLTRITRNLFSPFVALYVQDRLGTIVGAPRYTGFINAGACIGTALSAVTLVRLGDKYDKFKLTMKLSAIGLGISLLLIPKVPLLLFVVIYALYFFVFGAIEPVLTALASEVTDVHHRGVLFGVINTVNCAALVIAPLIGGFISMGFATAATLICIPIGTAIQLSFLVFESKRLHNSAGGIDTN